MRSDDDIDVTSNSGSLTAPAIEKKKETVDRTDDPVRMYLREMGAVELLSREGEIAIAKRIEAGRDTMILGLCESPLTFNAIIEWSNALNNGDMQLREIVDLEAMLSKDPAPENLDEEGAEDDGEISEKTAGVSFKDEDEVEGLSDAQRLAVIQQQLPDRVGRLLGISPLKCFPLGLNAERTLVEGRRIRIGNAAQTLHPVAGQGLNLGLRDAFALVEALRRDPQVDQALRRVEWQRAPDRWATILTTDFLARTFAWRWPGLPAALSSSGRSVAARRWSAGVRNTALPPSSVMP